MSDVNAGFIWALDGPFSKAVAKIDLITPRNKLFQTKKEKHPS
jgi:hypothetical protein